MDKLLENLQLIHRLLVVATVAAITLIFSVRPIDHSYSDAEAELRRLEDVFARAYELNQKEYKAINKASRLNEAITSWMEVHKVLKRDFSIETILPRQLAVPNPTYDSTATVGEMFRWADLAYHAFRNYIGIPTVLCDVAPDAVSHRLDALNLAGKTLVRFLIRVGVTNPEPRDEADFTCSISIEYEYPIGRTTTIARAELVQSGIAVLVTGIKDVWLDEYNIANLFKEEGFGDWEDSRYIIAPNVRALMPEIGNRELAGALAYLDLKSHEENERSKLKIEFLGAVLDAPTALLGIALVIFAFQVALIAHLVHVSHTLRGNEEKIRDSALLGPAKFWLGFFVITTSVLILPGGSVFIEMIMVLGSRVGQSSLLWVTNVVVRWGVTILVISAGFVLLGQVINILSTVRKWESRKKYIERSA